MRDGIISIGLEASAQSNNCFGAADRKARIATAETILTKALSEER
jgi:hypothetical protein